MPCYLKPIKDNCPVIKQDFKKSMTARIFRTYRIFRMFRIKRTLRIYDRIIRIIRMTETKEYSKI